ncbi:response regulator [Nostoc linckia FACHB-391]|uniref:Response regulator n=1 Tax=Nostoc linckia FACHB-391 TaxID=2692906 RepID=A0ABR8F8C1_NOSLI|nr:response regulator [Nostoc linckia FACHB-391]
MDPLQDLTVLIVDDNNDIIFLTEIILKNYGFHVLTASSASAAFEIIEKAYLDILIIDLGMPEESGYSLIERVRKLPPSQN